MIAIRPASAADILAVVGHLLPYRVRFQTIVKDGAPVAVGGLVYRPDGVWLSCLITDEARRARVSVHRAGLRAVALARELGLRELYAAADPSQPRSEAWLKRLGFRPLGSQDGGQPVWVWKAEGPECSTAP